MLTAAENDRLTLVGKGTPLGELMRRYWHPIAPVGILNENPVRKVKILGEELVLYRDRSGKLGLVGPRCAHRLVHMQFGIPEERGLRCPYHGWCYDETGQCIETPLESPNSRLKEHISIDGYPVQEMGGLVFAYLGPDPVPVLPPWDFLVWPNAIRQIGVTIVPCNWLQCHENSADPYHNTYLHGNFFKYQLERNQGSDLQAGESTTHRATSSMNGTNGHVGLVFDRDPYGFRKGIQFAKSAGAKGDFIRWFPYNIFPYYSRGTAGLRSQINMRVPMDDTHTYHLSYVVYHAPGVEAPPQREVPYFYAPLFDSKGEPILDYVLGQDMAAWYSQGAITDRTEEVLAATDLAIIEFRKIIDEQIRRVEEGKDPINYFLDQASVGDCIELSPKIGADIQDPMAITTYRSNFHKGNDQVDVDRYGPMLDMASELMRRSEEVRSAQSHP